MEYGSVIISLILGLIGGYFCTKYRFTRAHYEELNNIRAHYEVKLLKKTMEDRVREHG
tara:strand:+ start:616 stop:789 length:174 start_codon:yes stop_codon:yes gene_type:complete